MSWKDILKNDPRASDTPTQAHSNYLREMGIKDSERPLRDLSKEKQFLTVFEKKLEDFLNSYLFDEDDYNEEKLETMQRDINDGNALDGVGKSLNIKLSLEGGSVYVDIYRENGSYLTLYQMDRKGNFSGGDLEWIG